MIDTKLLLAVCRQVASAHPLILLDEAAIAIHCDRPLPITFRVGANEPHAAAEEMKVILCEHRFYVRRDRGYLSIGGPGNGAAVFIPFPPSEHCGLEIQALPDAVQMYVERMQQDPRLRIYPLLEAQRLDDEIFQKIEVPDRAAFVDLFMGRIERDLAPTIGERARQLIEPFTQVPRGFV